MPHQHRKGAGIRLARGCAQWAENLCLVPVDRSPARTAANPASPTPARSSTCRSSMMQARETRCAHAPARAWSISPSTSVKSNVPSRAQSAPSSAASPRYSGPVAASFGQIGFMYSRFDEDELCNSPESIRNGLPSTISCVAAPRFSRCGATFCCAPSTPATQHNNRLKRMQMWIFITARSVARTLGAHGRTPWRATGAAVPPHVLALRLTLWPQPDREPSPYTRAQESQAQGHKRARHKGTREPGNKGTATTVPAEQAEDGSPRRKPGESMRSHGPSPRSGRKNYFRMKRSFPRSPVPCRVPTGRSSSAGWLGPLVRCSSEPVHHADGSASIPGSVRRVGKLRRIVRAARTMRRRGRR